MNFKYSPEKKSTLVLWWINSAKELIAEYIAKKYWLEKSDIIHWDRLRIELYDSLSDKDKEFYFPKMHKMFSLWVKWVDLINTLWIQGYLDQEFKESAFLYDTMLQPIISNIWEGNKMVIAWVQIIPELLPNDIKWKEKFLWIIAALRTNPTLLRDREFEYAKLNHNHANYLYSYLQKSIDFEKLPKEDQIKLQDLSESLNLPISAYLLHLLAKTEYNKAIMEMLKKSNLDSEVTIIDTSVDFENKIASILH